MRPTAALDAVELPPHHQPIPRVPRVVSFAAAALVASGSAFGGLAAPAFAAGAAPIGVDDSYTIYANEFLTIATAAEGVLANDVDPDGEALVAGEVSDVFGGTVVTLLADGRFVFAPAVDFVGTATFDYRPSDGDLLGEPVTVSITVLLPPLPDLAPIAADDAYALQVGVPFVRAAADGVLANDTDPEGEPLVVVSSSGLPLDGPFGVSPDGALSWSPEEPFCGTTSFTYTVQDATMQTATATVTLTAVDEGNPVLCGPLVIDAAPVTGPDVYEVTPGAVAFVGALGSPSPGVLHNDIDPEGQPLTAELVSESLDGEFGLNATGAFEWAVPADFCGVATFQYRAFDGAVASAPQTVTLVAVDAEGAIECSDPSPAPPGEPAEPAEPADPAEPTPSVEPTTPAEPTTMTEPQLPTNALTPASSDRRAALATTGPSDAMPVLAGGALLLLLLGGMAVSARVRPRRRTSFERLARR